MGPTNHLFYILQRRCLLKGLLVIYGLDFLCTVKFSSEFDLILEYNMLKTFYRSIFFDNTTPLKRLIGLS